MAACCDAGEIYPDKLLNVRYPQAQPFARWLDRIEQASCAPLAPGTPRANVRRPRAPPVYRCGCTSDSVESIPDPDAEPRRPTWAAGSAAVGRPGKTCAGTYRRAFRRPQPEPARLARPRARGDAAIPSFRLRHEYRGA